MALATHVGTFNIAQTDEQVISGLGFKPKCLVLWHNRSSGDGADHKAFWTMGMVTDPSEQVVSMGGGTYAQGNNHIYSDHEIGYAIILDSSYRIRGSIESFDNDGFTFAWQDVFYMGGYVDEEIHYFALGGDDLINGKVITHNVASSDGINFFYGYGFEPNAVIVMPSYPKRTGDRRQSFGVATSNGEWAESYSQYANQEILRSSQVTDATSYVRDHQGIKGKSRFDHFFSNGFVLYTEGSLTSDFKLPALALELANPPVVGTITQSTSTGTQSIANIGLTPKLAMFSSVGGVAGEVRSDVALSQVWTDGSNQVGAVIGQGDDDHPFKISSHMTPLIFANPTPNDPWFTVVSQGSMAFAANGIDITWSQTDGVAREITYIVFGEKPPIVHEGAFEINAETSAEVSAQLQVGGGVELNGIGVVTTTPNVSIGATFDATSHSSQAFSATLVKENSLSLSTGLDAQVTSTRVRGYLVQMDTISHLSIYSAITVTVEVDWSASAALSVNPTNRKDAKYEAVESLEWWLLPTTPLTTEDAFGALRKTLPMGEFDRLHFGVIRKLPIAD